MTLEVEREVAANLSDLSVLLSRFGRPIDALSLSRKQLAHDRRPGRAISGPAPLPARPARQPQKRRLRRMAILGTRTKPSPGWEKRWRGAGNWPPRTRTSLTSI